MRKYVEIRLICGDCGLESPVVKGYDIDDFYALGVVATRDNWVVKTQPTTIYCPTCAEKHKDQ